MSATRTFKVKGMRVLLPSDKTREKNPDLKFTVVDPGPSDPLSIHHLPGSPLTPGHWSGEYIVRGFARMYL